MTATARFLERPNRFLVICRAETDGRRLRAHLPNSGRLAELLLPEARLFLEPRPPGSSGRTSHTVLAVERDHRPVFVHTHAANTVARRLIETQRIPSLSGARVVRAEAPHGPSRFDFLLSRDGREFFLEVKSVTLFGHGVAMFPDAPTARGRRHVEELAAIGRRTGHPPTVLFLVQTDRVGSFLPDYHTDLDFSRTLLRRRDDLRIVAAAIGWRPALGMPRRVRELAIPWDFLETEARDRGAYLLTLRLPRAKILEVGRLGPVAFRPGWYVYVGSAMRALSSRLARHQRLRKRKHWHIDYLRQAADRCRVYPIRSSRRLECDIAASLAEILERGPARFGASDCRCGTHLYRSDLDPVERADFHVLLQQYRMGFIPSPPGDAAR